MGTALAFGQTADLVVHNARIYTLDPAHPTASAIAVSKGRILALDGEVPAHIGSQTRQIDAGGRAVVPGLIDAHGHMAGLGLSLGQVDLRAITSEAEACQQIAAAAKQKKPNEWILGRSWDQNLWPGKQFPTRQCLDAAAPRNPVFLTRVDGHAAWVNSRALNIAGVGSSTPDPSGGRIVRGPDGSPSGVLVDRAQALVGEKIPPPDKKALQSALERAAHECSRVGLTSVHDAGVSGKVIEAYRELESQGKLPVRIYAMIAVPASENLWKQYQTRGPEIGPFLTIRSLKLVADGALGSRGAALQEPYSDDPSNRGLLILSRSFIEETAREAVKAGFQVNTHAIGDLANRTVLDAYSAALAGANDRRFRIEHAQIVAPADFARFKKYDVIASMQPTHATSDMPWAMERLGPERLEGAYAWQTFLRSGVRLACGSDFPVESANPMLGFYSAITRSPHRDPAPSGWVGQKLSRDEALRCFTTDAAFAAFEEKDKGSLAPGKLADFVILSEDIMQVPEERIPKVRVTTTVVNGRVVYSE